MQHETAILLLSSIFCILGMVLIISGYRKISIYDQIKKTGIKTVGVVEQIIKSSNGGGPSGITYLPLIKFKINNEEIINTPKNSIQSNPTWYEAGERFTIYYQPDNPSKFVIEKWTEKAVAWALIVIGMLFFGGSLYFYLDNL